MSHHDRRTVNESIAHGSEASLSEEQKLIKLIEYWIRHNEEHARSYREWADRARNMGHKEGGGLLENVAAGTVLQNETLKKVLTAVKREDVFFEHNP